MITFVRRSVGCWVVGLAVWSTSIGAPSAEEPKAIFQPGGDTSFGREEAFVTLFQMLCIETGSRPDAVTAMLSKLISKEISPESGKVYLIQRPLVPGAGSELIFLGQVSQSYKDREEMACSVGLSRLDRSRVVRALTAPITQVDSQSLAPAQRASSIDEYTQALEGGGLPIVPMEGHALIVRMSSRGEHVRLNAVIDASPSGD